MDPIQVQIGELLSFVFLLSLAMATSTRGQSIGLFVAIFAALDRAPQGVALGFLLAYAFGREKKNGTP